MDRQNAHFLRLMHLRHLLHPARPQVDTAEWQAYHRDPKVEEQREARKLAVKGLLKKVFLTSSLKSLQHCPSTWMRLQLAPPPGSSSGRQGGHGDDASVYRERL